MVEVTTASRVEIGTTTVWSKSPSVMPASVNEVELPFASGAKYMVVEFSKVSWTTSIPVALINWPSE